MMSWSVTSATITVMLSGPPPRSASWTSRSAHCVRVGVLAQRRRDAVVADRSGQPVAADQVPVARDRRPHRVGRVDVPDRLQRADEQRPLRVDARLLFGDPTLVDEHLHVRVVLGDLDELAVAQQIGPRVADMHHAELACRRRACRSASCPCPRAPGWRRPRPADSGWRCRPRRATHRPARRRGRPRRACAIAAMARLLATSPAAMPPMPSATASSRGPGIDRVLVAVPDQPAVAAGGIAQGQSHGRNSSEVRPMRIGTPRGTGVGPVTFARSR